MPAACAAPRPPSRDIQVLGPAEAPLALIAGRHRFRLLVHGERRSDMQGFVRAHARRPARRSAARSSVQRRHRPAELPVRPCGTATCCAGFVGYGDSTCALRCCTGAAGGSIMEFAFPWPMTQGEWLAWSAAAVTVFFGADPALRAGLVLRACCGCRPARSHPEAVAAARATMAGFYLGARPLLHPARPSRCSTWRSASPGCSPPSAASSR